MPDTNHNNYIIHHNYVSKDDMKKLDEVLARHLTGMSVILSAPLGCLSRPPSGSSAHARGWGLTLERAGQVVPGGGASGTCRDYPGLEVVHGHDILWCI